MLQYLVACALILVLFAGWVGVQELARRFAQRHPEFGAAKEEGGGCASGGCGMCKLVTACSSRE
ncbi:MAG: hypothetical protein ACLFSI_03965 [Halorhodospira sp.]